MKTSQYARITGLTFALVAGAHALRLASGWEANVGSFEVPMWVSAIVVLVAGYLAWRGLSIAR